MTNTELLPCPFERGQVWKNPEDYDDGQMLMDFDCGIFCEEQK